MKRKSRKSLYFFIPLSLVIKIILTVLLFNLPGGCREAREHFQELLEPGSEFAYFVDPYQNSENE
ncbi:MAG TPA: hypothetical protein PLO24_03515 [Bacteroidales bacterium]|jgi:hypothetical protein|nr:hypothetical protein [Bacteroidales bacterium]HOS71410.1 hypothetical protein [Bacteroidales bacterium]HQH23711.1 hypothetical protein [Bacteroidales bacterium]HQJ82284.1 hypothetical protein [Bacteroidales bacterium]